MERRFVKLTTGDIIYLNSYNEKTVTGINLSSPQLRIKNFNLKQVDIDHIVTAKEKLSAMKDETYYAQLTGPTGIPWKHTTPRQRKDRYRYIQASLEEHKQTVE